MLTEDQRMELVQDLFDNTDYRYPLASGASQYDCNSGNVKTMFRDKEPLEMVYPSVKINFLPTIERHAGGMNDVYAFVYASADLEPVIITAYTRQNIVGNSGTGYHGKPIADSMVRQMRQRVRKYWPSLLRTMEASLKVNLGFQKLDISNVTEGSQRQAFELTFYIVTTNKWDLLIDPTDTTDPYFEDAIVSGQDDLSYAQGVPYQKYHTISGLTNLVT